MDGTNFPRRDFLRLSAAGVAGMSLLNTSEAAAWIAPPQPAPPLVITPKLLKPSLLSMEGISRRTIEEHYKLYTGYVNKANEIFEALKAVDRTKANQTYSPLRELKVELSFALGGVRNHEIYFGHLGGTGGEPRGKLRSHLESGFGSYADWETDFKATGMAARGWVWLAYDLDQRTLFNYLGDAQNTFPVWNAVVLATLDTYEHAYFLDFAVDRKGYIEAFMKNLDWSVIEKRYEDLITKL